MKVTLLNIGTSQRNVADVNGRNVMIGVGRMQEADITERAHRTIKGREDQDSLLIVEEKKIPVKMQIILDLLKDFAATPYDRLLTQVNEVMGADPGKVILRPTREAMRTMLVAAARHYAHKTFDVSPAYNKKAADAIIKRPLVKLNKGRAVANEKDVKFDSPFDDVDEGSGVESEEEFEALERKAEQEAKGAQGEGDDAPTKSPDAKAQPQPAKSRKAAKARRSAKRASKGAKSQPRHKR